MVLAANNLLDRVTRRGTKFNRRGFALYYLKVLDPPRPRIVISQKIDKRAVVRNRLRRQIKAILSGADLGRRAVVIIVRKELLALSFSELKTELGQVLTQIQ
ncbi:MAG: ribonuclease P protein component [Patescibacteria group bacterium]|jgi:ribonuclease P protein component